MEAYKRKTFYTMDYKKREEGSGNCLECGTSIYGRSDKKFCSEDCKNHYHNRMARESQSRKTAVLSILATNYEILNNLIRYKVNSYLISDLNRLGFRDGYMTECRKVHHHWEHSCFDIKYYVTGNKIFGIRKESVNIP